MFARLLRAPKSGSDRSRNIVRLTCEPLEDRSVPAIVTFTVDTTADTKYDHFDLDLSTPVDANGMTSLRAVIEYANLNPVDPLDGDWNTNRYDVDLSMIGGGTITLDPNRGPLALNTNFNFLANAGAVTITRSLDPNNRFNHFSVAADTESHFNNLTLTNGETPFDGGSISNNGTVQIMTCTFANNSAGFDGGAIVANSGATTVIMYCMFANNSAGRDGGAVAAQEGSLATSISDCTLTENEAVGRGGAVFANGAGSLSISGSYITWNQATGVAVDQGLGAGVFVKDTASATISNTDIIDNIAAWQGGGLYVQDCNLTMTGGSLFHNTSAGHGGGFYIDADNKTVTLSQVSITNNTATGGKGGGGYLEHGTLTGSLTALTGNTAGQGFNGIAVGVNATEFRDLTIPTGQQTADRL